jgi:hypothetical protein
MNASIKPAFQVYPAILTKRSRRTKAQIETLQELIHDILAADHPMTVRQVFYRVVSRGAIAKTENEFNNTVCRLLVKMRRSGQIPFHWISDNTRWMRKPRTFSCLEDALRLTQETYRRSLWDNQDVYVEVWTEKDALAGVLLDVTKQWDVPLMVSRGFASMTYLHNAAENIAAQNKPTFIYYFGDHDPSGVIVDRKIEQGLREFAPNAEIYFDRVAVRSEQITELGLLTRPTKTAGAHSKNFKGESVEVDAIEPARLRLIVRECIEQHVDREALSVLKAAERSEREIFTRLVEQISEPNT